MIASKAHIDALAARLRQGGLHGTPSRLRALVLVDLTQGRNPLDRVTPHPAPAPGTVLPGSDPATGYPANDSQAPGQRIGDAAEDNRTPEQPAAGQADEERASGQAHESTAPSPGDPPGDNGLDGRTGRDSGETERDGHRHALVGDRGAGDRGAGLDDNDGLSHSPVRSGNPAPLPALVNLLVPAGTLLGWGTAAGQAAGWGLLDADETRALVQAASQHPRTRWCFTLIAPDGSAVAHACAPGRHSWVPPGHSHQQSREKEQEPGGILGFEQTAQLADFLGRFNITFEPIARDTCDHRHAEDRYVPSRKLRHLLRARNQACTAPACNAQALYCDIDHTIAYPDGPTDECNTNPKCRRHHRTKQAPGWQVNQPTPDTTTWTTPSGRTHASGPTVYDL